MMQRTCDHCGVVIEARSKFLVLYLNEMDEDYEETDRKDFHSPQCILGWLSAHADEVDERLLTKKEPPGLELAAAPAT